MVGFKDWELDLDALEVGLDGSEEFFWLGFVNPGFQALGVRSGCIRALPFLILTLHKDYIEYHVHLGHPETFDSLQCQSSRDGCDGD